MVAEGGDGSFRREEGGGLFSGVRKGDSDCCTGGEEGWLVSEVGECGGMKYAREDLLLGAGNGVMIF